MRCVRDRSEYWRGQRWDSPREAVHYITQSDNPYTFTSKDLTTTSPSSSSPQDPDAPSPHHSKHTSHESWHPSYPSQWNPSTPSYTPQTPPSSPKNWTASASSTSHSSRSTAQSQAAAQRPTHSRKRWASPCAPRSRARDRK